MRKIHRDIVGGFIFSSDGKLLVGKSRKGGVYTGAWIIPGGGIDEGETHLEALAREITEETGIDISDAKVEQINGELTGKSEKTLKENDERVIVDMTFYNYTIHLHEKADNIVIAAEDDFIEAKWVALSQIGGLKLSPPTITTLKRLGYL